MNPIDNMTTVKRRKRGIFVVYAFLFLLGGVEYAVILPTLWLYLHNTYNAPEYMLGLVLSAYSLAAFFSAPFIGRISDRTGRTKALLIICSCFQAVGSILYLLGISQWLCVASRFICGIGGAAEAVSLAEVSRHSPEQELTGIMSKLVAMRQMALLAAPGLNLVLRLVDIKIGPFDINKYTVPGAFMAVLWILFIFITLIFYTEPRIVYGEERRLNKLASKEKKEQLAQTVESAVIIYDTINQVSNVSEYTSSARHDEKTTSTPPQYISPRNGSVSSTQGRPQLDDLSTSYEVMASAERFIYSSEMNGQQESVHSYEPGDSWSIIETTEASPLLKEDPFDSTVTNSTDIQTIANDDYIENHVSHIDDLIAREGKLGFFCKEYIRDDVMAIITLLFCALFSQIALEAMCTPLSLEYMDFGEFENSILYCACGVEVILAFMIVSKLSQFVADRNMILFGGFLLLAANIWLIIFLPTAPHHSRSQNLPRVGLAVSMDVFSLPFLLVCATSLYSKMTRKETQGLSQGLRRGVVGLGTILAPLWASSIVQMPYLVLGVLIGIQSLSLLMCLMSYKRLKALEPSKKIRSNRIPNTDTSPIVARNQNSPVNDIANTRNAVLPPSSQYGSIDSKDHIYT